jgi:hypothetical protein
MVPMTHDDFLQFGKLARTIRKKKNTATTPGRARDKSHLASITNLAEHLFELIFSAHFVAAEFCRHHCCSESILAGSLPKNEISATS